MAIIFISGPACAGKSTFIKENFPNKRVIDLYDFQKDIRFFTFETIWQSYVDCLEEMKKCINNKEDFVLEHTLLKAQRRAFYIEELRKITNEDIEIYFLYPSEETLTKQSKERKCFYGKKDIQDQLELCELPTKEEGFSEVHIISK